MKLWPKLNTLFSRRRLECEMSDEMQAHLDGLTERNIAKGISPQDARYAAMREFGHVEGIKEECRDQRGWGWMRDLGQDLRYGARQLRKAPGFATVAILTLAIGIGATTAIFSIVNNVVLRPLPYEDADRLVRFRETTPESTEHWGVSRRVFEEWRTQITSCEKIITSAYWPGILTGTDTPIRFYGWVVSPDFFQTLGIQPILGRTFRPEEMTGGNDRVVILSYRLWQSQFNGRRDIIGEVVRVNDEPRTIVGVLPQDFFPEPILDPVIFTPDTTPFDPSDASSRYVRVIGKLKPGATLEKTSKVWCIFSKKNDRSCWLFQLCTGFFASFGRGAGTGC